MRDLTVVFSGHNICSFANLAIRTFRYHHPELYNNVVYFDDYSTDDTVKQLQEEDVICITWDEEYKNMYDTYFNDKIKQTNKHLADSVLATRCEFIFKSILKQCKTQYLLILDGDTVTFNNSFVRYCIANTKNPIVYPTSSGRCNASGFKVEFNNPFTSYLLKAVDFNTQSYRRARPTVLFLDLYALSDILNNCYSNLYHKDYLDLINGDFADVGSDLYIECMLHGIPQSHYDELSIYHFEWISSSFREIAKLNNIGRLSLKDHFIHEQNLSKACKIAGVTYKELQNTLETNRLKSVNN